jgi:NADP-dependent 3-hydroxy acid dehydrogenase YdfG
MPASSKSMIGKAVITGASSGLGHAIARLLIKKAINVVNISRRRSGLHCENIVTDLTRNASIQRMVDLVKKRHSDCNLLILCAGVLHWHNAGENPIDQVDNDIGVNLTGMIKVVDGLMPLIRRNRGDIVIIGSTSSFNTPPGSSVYCAAKHGVLGYIKALQAECKNENVRILGIHPGGFKSEFHIKAKTDIDHTILIDPGDLARLIVAMLALPRNMEVSEIIINRKAAATRTER